MALTSLDLENKIKEQAGALAIASLQIQSLIDDNNRLKKLVAEQEEKLGSLTQPDPTGRRRKGK